MDPEFVWLYMGGCQMESAADLEVNLSDDEEAYEVEENDSD